MTVLSQPILDPLPVDLPLLMRLLARVEADHHRHGWDQPPRLMVVYDERDEQTADIYRKILGGSPNHGTVPRVRVAPYIAQTLIPPMTLIGLTPQGRPTPELRGRKVWENLRTFALAMAYAPSDALNDIESGRELAEGTGADPMELMRGTLRLEGLIGFLFCGEAWARALTREEHIAELSSGHLDYSDKPDSVEHRMVYCVDLYDRVHVVQRERGDKPETIETADGPRTIIVPGADTTVREEASGPWRGDITTSLRILADVSTGRTPPKELFHQWYPTLLEAIQSDAFNPDRTAS